MSYLRMTGTLLNVLTTSARVDRKTGEAIPPRHQVQLQVESPLENGERRIELQTLTVVDRKPFDAQIGREVAIPVGVFVSGAKLQFFVPKGSALPPRDGAAGTSAAGSALT